MVWFPPGCVLAERKNQRELNPGTCVCQIMSFPQSPYIYICIYICKAKFQKEAEKEEERKRQVTCQMATVAWAGSGWHQARAQALGRSSTSFPGALLESLRGTEVASTEVGAHVGLPGLWTTDCLTQSQPPNDVFNITSNFIGISAQLWQGTTETISAC